VENLTFTHLCWFVNVALFTIPIRVGKIFWVQRYLYFNYMLIKTTKELIVLTYRIFGYHYEMIFSYRDIYR
jgi:hypothetical protein